MKVKLLSALLLFYWGNCMGQTKTEPDSVYYLIQDTATGEYIYSVLMPYSEPIKKPDTLPVLIAYSDTQTIYSTSSHSYPYQTTPVKVDTIAVFNWEEVKWMRGWIIDEHLKYPQGYDWDDYRQYLDYKKRPLDKSIIIWQVKYLFK